MATNAKATNAKSKEKSKEPVNQVTEEDLKALKAEAAEVETEKSDDTATEGEEDSQEESEVTGQESDQIGDQAETSGESEVTFTKKFPNIKGETLEEYIQGLEAAYDNSTAEFQKLKLQSKPEEKEEVDTSDPVALYMRQKMDEEIASAFDGFLKDYPQVKEETNYDKFTKEVDTLSRTILASQGRLAPPAELYAKAAVILEWEKNQPDDSDKLGAKLKDDAAVTKTNSLTRQTARSKVTDKMIVVNRKMYPDKTDAQIRQELEEYIQ